MPQNLKKNVPLSSHTTLGVGGNAEFFCEVTSVDELREVLIWAKESHHHVTVLGGGSNVLISDTGIQGLVIKLNFLNIEYTNSGDKILVTAGAGIVLDTLVAELVEKRLWGLENFSAIPGSVGAVPIQNVGAYGLETKDVLHTVLVYDRENDTTYMMNNSECEFAYRDSIFKHHPNRYCVLAVTFTLSSNPQPKLAYRDLEKSFKTNTTPSIEEIRDAIIKIRSAKFPDWKTIGTAGSFFKNPIITEEAFQALTTLYHEVPGYRAGEGKIKISLGWILDHVCGLRGYREGNVRLFEHQALVLVCERGTTAREIETFSQKIIDMVFQKTNVVVEREVTILK